VEELNGRAERAVDQAIEFAERSPMPAPEEALTDVYVSYR
jgi:TPP-dependent pyruvate/acetoin dehydrogenase alpha subunit